MIKNICLILLALNAFLYAEPEKVLCFGDSITQGTHIKGRYTTGRGWVNILDQKSTDLEFVNAGRSGRRTHDRKELQPYLKEMKSYSRVIFFLGVNDLNTPKVYSLKSCLKNIQSMVKQCRKANPKIKIAICAPTKINTETIKAHFYKMGYNEAENKLLEKLAKLYRAYCRQKSLDYIDLQNVVSPANFFDGLHPNLSGQQQIADAVWKALYPKRVKLKIACVGDSITYGAGIKDRAQTYPAQLQKLLGDKFEVRNFGVSARTLLKKGDRPYWREQAYQDALNWVPDRVIIKLGTNDIKPGNWKHREQIAADLKALVQSFQRVSSQTQVYLSYPVPIQESRWGMLESTLKDGLMPKIKETAKDMSLPIVDFHAAVPSQKEYFSDGVHPNAAGAKLMADCAFKAFKLKLKRYKNTALNPVSKLENDFYNWEQRHAEIKGMAKKGKTDLIFIGDSITHMFGGLPKSKIVRGGSVWNKYYAHRKTINMGFGWDRIQNVLWRIKDGALDDISPKVAVVMIGTNNLTGTKNARTNSAKEIAEGIKAVCLAVHKKLPKCKIILLGVLPRSPKKFAGPIREINKRVKALGKQKCIHFINIYEQFVNKDGLPKKELMRDTVHPNVKGYQFLAELMEPVLSKYLKDKKVEVAQ